MENVVARAYNGGLRALSPAGSRGRAPGQGPAAEGEDKFAPFLNFQMIKYEPSETAYIELLTLSPPIPSMIYTLPYWSNPSFFLIFDIRALWRSVLSARAPDCQKVKN